MRSGKTKLVEVLERLVPRPLFVSGITVSFLERAIEAHRPTLLIDEYDALTSGDPALAEAARAQLNRSAKRRGARVGKNVPLPGGGYESRLFSTWAPTVIAGIGDPPSTVRDRAVVIDLKRKLSSEKVRPLRERDGADLAILRSKIARWVGDNEMRLRAHSPAALDVDNDRAKDMWEPLLAIAEIAGGDWPRRAREAGLALAEAQESETVDADVRLLLLADIRDIFAAAFPPDHADHKATREGRPSDGPPPLTGDKVARERLDKLNAQSAVVDLEVDNAKAAVEEGKRRLAVVEYDDRFSRRVRSGLDRSHLVAIDGEGVMKRIMRRFRIDEISGMRHALRRKGADVRIFKNYQGNKPMETNYAKQVEEVGQLAEGVLEIKTQELLRLQPE